LEGKAAALAALTATPQQKSAIAKALQALNKATFQELQRYDFNREFHMSIAVASNNVFIQEMIDALMTRSSAIGFKEAIDRGGWVQLEGRHQPIYDAIVAGDAAAAQAAVVMHFDAMRHSIGEK
jgi:DNA-binding FadR family transcriptional regulator